MQVLKAQIYIFYASKIMNFVLSFRKTDLHLFILFMININRWERLKKYLKRYLYLGEFYALELVFCLMKKKVEHNRNQFEKCFHFDRFFPVFAVHYIARVYISFSEFNSPWIAPMETIFNNVFNHTATTKS